jgi:hypothetical protein
MEGTKSDLITSSTEPEFVDNMQWVTQFVITDNKKASG